MKALLGLPIIESLTKNCRPPSSGFDRTRPSLLSPPLQDTDPESLFSLSCSLGASKSILTQTKTQGLVEPGIQGLGFLGRIPYTLTA